MNHLGNVGTSQKAALATGERFAGLRLLVRDRHFYSSQKALLRAAVKKGREQEMSYRGVAQELGLHWTRIHQIV